jgi:uncharacterized membrane protein
MYNNGMDTSFRNFIKALIPLGILALGMSLFRVEFTGQTRYLWMNWNLFLALVPLLFAWVFVHFQNTFSKIISFLAWLFFLPNSLYLITDFIHLGSNTAISELLWYDGLMIFIYSVIGMLVSFFSLDKIVSHLSLRRLTRYSLIFLISLLVSFGIYLGRYIRWNTWDIIAQPFALFANIFEVITTHIYDPRFYLMIIFLTLFGFLGYLSYEKFSRL